MRRAADSGERINRGPLANAQLAIGLGLRVSNAGYFAGATSLTGVPSDLVFSPGLLAAFKSRSISPARRACQRQRSRAYMVDLMSLDPNIPPGPLSGG